MGGIVKLFRTALHTSLILRHTGDAHDLIQCITQVSLGKT